MEKFSKKIIIVFLAIFTAILPFNIFADAAAPAYPIEFVEMDEMSTEMKDALIRSVITEKEEIRLAKMLYGEERQYDYVERAAVIWHTFNRIDSPLEANTIARDVTHSHYSGYSANNPVEDWAIWVVRDVAWRYACERAGYEDVGRVLPQEYLYMAMHKGHNRFRTKYKGKCRYWDWSIQSPYAESEPWNESMLD